MWMVISLPTVRNIVVPGILLSVLLLGCTTSTPGTEGPSKSGETPTTAAEETAEVPTPPPAEIEYQVVMQAADDSVVLVSRDQQIQVLGYPGMTLSNAHAITMPAGKTLYVLPDVPSTEESPIHAITGQGIETLTLNPGQSAQGIVALPGADDQPDRLAWSTTTPTEETLETTLFVSDASGENQETLLTLSSNDFRTLLPVRWTSDGSALYYSKQAVGLGGYILFGGYTDLYRLDLETEADVDMLAGLFDNAFICLDDISTDYTLVAHHCEGVGVVNITDQSSIAIEPPNVAYSLLGSVRFAPDGSRVAFAMAAGRGSQALLEEQGWIAVSDGLTGASHLLATSEPGSYYEVLGWLDDQTLLAQLWDLAAANNSVWTIDVDSGELTLLSNGRFLGVLAMEKENEPG